MPKTTRHDMLVELVTDQINSIEQMIRDDEYQDVHTWLHPILFRELKLDYADWSDDDLETYYCDRLGVDIPSSPPLSSEERAQRWSKANAQERKEQEEEELTSEETPNHGTVPQPSRMECSPVSGVYQVRNAESMAEVATALRSFTQSEKAVQGFEPTTEIRIPMCMLFRLVHGERGFR